MIASVVVGMLILFTGCGVHLDPTGAAPARWLEPPKVSAQAQQLYSKEQLTTAYEELTQLAFDRSFEASLLDPQQREYTAEQLNEGVWERMTPGLRERWDARVADALSGNEEAKDGVRILRFFAWEQPNWHLPKSGRPLLSQRIGNVEIGVAPATPEMPQRLNVTFTIEASMEYQEAGVNFPIVVSKRISHWLLPADGSLGFAWNLDEYEGVLATDEDLPVETVMQNELPAPPPSQDEESSKAVGKARSDFVGRLAAIPAGQAELRERYGFDTASSAADGPPSNSKVAADGSPRLRPSAADPLGVNQRQAATSQSPAMAEPPLTTGRSAPTSLPQPGGIVMPPVTTQPPPATTQRPQPKPEPAPPVGREPKPEPARPVEPEPKPQPKPEPARPVEPEPKPQPKPEPARPVEPEPKPDPAPPVKPERKPESPRVL